MKASNVEERVLTDLIKTGYHTIGGTAFKRETAFRLAKQFGLQVIAVQVECPTRGYYTIREHVVGKVRPVGTHHEKEITVLEAAR